MSHCQPDLSVIIVSWNVRELLRDCLASVTRAIEAGGLAAELFVVDNASRDGSVSMIEELFPRARLLANELNLGFTKANNQALRLCNGRHVLLLNPDTTVAPDALRLMIEDIDAHPQVGAIGPKLLFPDGSVQSSRRRFPSMATALLESTVFQRLVPGHNTLTRYYLSDRTPDSRQEVDWLVGACLMVRRSAIEQVGLLDEGFFMYSEELDWCRRLAGAGWSIVYLPDAQVVHFEAKSSDQGILARHQHFHDSKVRYFDKYHGRVAAFAVRLVVTISFACMLFEETIKYLLRPAKRKWRRPRLGILAQAMCYHFRKLFR